MQKLIQSLLSLILIFILSSCGNSEHEKEQNIKIKKEEELKKINEKSISNLMQKYNCNSDWDSIDTFTYILQEKFTESNNSLSFKGRIIDIFKSDSNYFLKILGKSKVQRKSIALISIDSKKMIELKKQIKFKFPIKYGCFIIKVSNITCKPTLQIHSSDDLDMEAIFINPRYKYYILKGALVDFFIENI